MRPVAPTLTIQTVSIAPARSRPARHCSAARHAAAPDAPRRAVAERGHERGVDARAIALPPAELEVRGGAAVVDHGHPEPEIGAGADGGVDAHAAHHPGDDELVDALGAQLLVEL